MQIITESDFSGVDHNHVWAEQFQVLNYSQGGCTLIPHKFFRNWLDQSENIHGKFYIGKCSGLGVGSIVKYDAGLQNLHIGRFVAGGLRLKFLLNGQHEMRTISTSMLSVFDSRLKKERPSLWKRRGGFFMCYNVEKFQFQENINGCSDI